MRGMQSSACATNPHGWTKWSIFDFQFALVQKRIRLCATSEASILVQKSTFWEHRKRTIELNREGWWWAAGGSLLSRQAGRCGWQRVCERD